MVGRFIGEDPIGFVAGDANLYRYVRNSPIQGTDPMGLLVVTPIPVPVATPWYVPLLRRVPWVTPLVIPGGLLNPQPTNPYEFPRDLPQNKPKFCQPSKPKRKQYCEFIYESPGRPDSAFKTCAYDCKGYGGLATFPWPKNLPCPKSFDGLVPNIPPGYPDPNLP